MCDLAYCLTHWLLVDRAVILNLSFLPEASFGLWVLSSPASVCVSVCVCVNHLLVHAISWDPLKLGSPNLDQRCKRPWLRSLLGGNWPWPSRSNLTSKSEFTPFWACPDHNSSPIQVRITKFWLEVENSLVKVPIILGGNWPWPSRSNLIKTAEFFYQTYWRCFCKYLVRPSPVYI